MNTLRALALRGNSKLFIQRAYATTKKKISVETDEDLPS